MKNITFQSLLLRAFKSFGKHPAVTFLKTNETLTYDELSIRIHEAANYLHSLGVQRGTQVVVSIPNSIEYLVFSLGVIKCGATLVPIGEKLGTREVEFILKDTEPKAVLVGTANHVETIFQYVNESNGNNVKALGIPGFGHDYPKEFELYSRVQSQVAKMEEASPDDLAAIFYSGGTTGVPKGIMHSQRTLAETLVANTIENSIDDRDRVFLSTPLPHAAGLFFWRSVLAGAHVFLTDKFDPEVFFYTVQEKRITITYLVPTMLYRLIDLGKKEAFDIHSLRTVHYGAAPIDPKRLKEGFEMFGSILKQHYGQSECPNMITRLSKSDHDWAYHYHPQALKSAGKPCLFAEVRLVDDQGMDVERGEIIVKAPYRSLGYYNRPDLTQEAIRDGWVYTGDIGEMDEHGYLYIVDRKKDMIISGGMNIYSIEVENVVNQHPAVAMCACVGVPHADWGETVCVFAVLREGVLCTKEELIEFCKARTAKYMVPKAVHFKEWLPLTPIGKIDKKELKKVLLETQNV
ncbi:class I adenylate-forming enzyme family protein [Neobacillus citreus]|uniref:AMP-binding protein n=1 Tax=Neobacillus citreus TaxID=2833578 RepID=A0A942YB22_9BACI|nr:AMP-binding protein [Neobacillus citreus]MCH6267966.1 AMP-binding protein [Neobacillus citreus]